MENASKALIIAGAILIAILLIGVGMFIFTSANEPITEAGSQMSEQKISMFNSKFENFNGKQNGSSVKSLISKVIANNINEDNDVKVKVTHDKAVDKDDANGLSTISAGIKSGKTYTITFAYDTEGRIEKITITG